jgi:hypothetical protein
MIIIRNRKQGCGSVFIFLQIRIQSLRLETNPDPDPDPIRIQGFNDQKLKKITAEIFFIFFFYQKLQFTFFFFNYFLALKAGLHFMGVFFTVTIYIDI